eukprot:gene30393-37602_t
MPFFRPEPPYTHGQPERTAVLLCNLGTPDEPTAPALRRYLGQFLSDHRVVEIPKLVWMLILHGIILRVRPAKSAAKYASVWTPEGSPLAVWTTKQATLLRGWLGQAGHGVLVRHAMRYGNPSIASQLDALKAEGATRILVLPLGCSPCAATMPATCVPCSPSSLAGPQPPASFSSATKAAPPATARSGWSPSTPVSMTPTRTPAPASAAWCPYKAPT